jgi:hypothetical protein
MNRRKFIQLASATAGTTLSGVSLLLPHSARAAQEREANRLGRKGLSADVVIAGGGLGGCAAALAALRNGLRVIMTEETDWIGGQLTQQGVPPDEHRWIESFGCTRSYRELRNAIREYYRSHYPLTEAARSRWNLNPGDGSVSRLCSEPRVALAVLHALLAPYLSGRRLVLLLQHKVIAADVERDKIRSLNTRNLTSGNELSLEAPYFLDATELGDLLPLAGAEFVTGAESQKDTGELHAPPEARPDNHQSFTFCFAIDYLSGEHHIVEKPREYDFWREFVPQLRPPWPGKLLDLTYTHPSTMQPRRLGFNPEGESPGAPVNLWNYRRVARKTNFQPGAYPGDICLVNWPQNDYFLGNLIGVTPEDAARHIDRAKQLSLSLLYWLQTEAPRSGGKQGFPELRLRPDILGTEDGLAKYPYIRESRRIKAVFTVLEQHVGSAARSRLTGRKESEVTAESFFDSVGIGSYPIDLHPSTGGDNYIDISSLPFQIPLGALLPRRMENLIPAAKNLGVTHITNGCYRLHPVEWNIGEAAASLAAFAFRKGVPPRAVREKETLLSEFQNQLRAQGAETHWPKGQF